MSKSKHPTSELDPGTEKAQLRARVIDLSSREPAPTRGQLAQQQRVVLAIVMLVPLLVFMACGGIRVGPRPERLVLQTALGSALLAAGFSIIGIGRGQSMLGRPRSWLLAQVLLTPTLLFGCRVLTSLGYPQMMIAWADRPGLRCFTLSLVLSLAPLLGLLWLRRGGAPLHPRLTAAALGAAAGAGAWVLVDLWCPVGYVPHVLLGHVLPLLVLSAGSALFGSRVVAVRTTLVGR